MKRLHCRLFGHNYQVSRTVTYHVKEYCCKNCKKELTTSSNGQLVELTPKFKEINDVLERIHLKKTKKHHALPENETVDLPFPLENLLVFSH